MSEETRLFDQHCAELCGMANHHSLPGLVTGLRCERRPQLRPKPDPHKQVRSVPPDALALGHNLDMSYFLERRQVSLSANNHYGGLIAGKWCEV